MAKSELGEADTEVDPNLGPVRYGQSVAEMYEVLKREQRLCIGNGDYRDSSVIQIFTTWLDFNSVGVRLIVTRQLRQSTMMDDNLRHFTRRNSEDRNLRRCTTGYFLTILLKFA